MSALGHLLLHRQSQFSRKTCKTSNSIQLTRAQYSDLHQQWACSSVGNSGAHTGTTCKLPMQLQSNVQLASCSCNCDRAGTYIQTHPLHNKARKCIPKEINIPPVNSSLAIMFSVTMGLTYQHHQARKNVRSLRAANQGKPMKNVRKTVCKNQQKKVDEAGRLYLVQWYLYGIGIAHKGSFHRLMRANLLHSAQQTRNSHKKQDTLKAKFKWHKNCHCNTRAKQKALNQGYIMLGCMMWRAALVTAATWQIKCSVRQVRATFKCIAIYNGQRKVQHR